MKKHLIFLILLLASAAVFGQDTDADVNKIIEAFRQKHKVPGVALTITHKNKVILSRGYGYADKDKLTPVDPAVTKFRIASITKSMTAVTLGRLEELGMLKLDNSVYAYLPQLPKKKYGITIAQVAGHLSGIRRVASEESYTCDNTYDKDDFYRVFAKDDLLFEPGTKMLYSNYGFKLLGMIIEEVTHTDLREAHKKYVIDVLRMDSTLPDTGVHDANTAKFYTEEKGEVVAGPCINCTFKYAAGCYLGTSEDLAKFGNAVLYPGKLVSNATMVKLVKSQKFASGKKTGYGMGFTSGPDAYGNLYYGHNGGYVGSRSAYHVYPESQLVIAILTNKDVADIDTVVADIAKVVTE